MTALTALAFYISGLWVVALAASSIADLSALSAAVFAAVAGLPFLWLLSRLYTHAEEPWPGFAKPALIAGLFFSVSLLISWEGVFSGPFLSAAARRQEENLRAARSLFFAHVQRSGAVPAEFPAAVALPELRLPGAGHKPSAALRTAGFADIQDSGRWLYVADSTSPALLIDCVHLDRKGRPWSSY